MVFRIAYHYTCNREEAEDISQVVFGRYYIFSETGRVTNVRSWLATTARNVAVNHVKHISYERLLWAKETMEDYLGYEEDPEEQFFGTLREKDEIECACRILAALKTKKRKWYNLAVYAYCNEMPRQEIADRMGMSLNAVMSTLTRIKDWIRKNIKTSLTTLILNRKRCQTDTFFCTYTIKISLQFKKLCTCNRLNQINDRIDGILLVRALHS